jgi:hypothetical protein
MFCNFYLLKNHQIASYSKTTEAIKNRHRFVILRMEQHALKMQTIV